jgi:signal transduction histidine kinase
LQQTGYRTVDGKISEFSGAQLQANRFDIVSRLADDLAHEIKNPLNAIVINLEVLKVRIAKGDVDGASDRTGVIEQEVRRLHQLIDRMLLLIRPERADTANVPVDSALDEILPLVHAQTRLARNEFVVDGEATVFVPVRREAFKFALLNLLMAVHERLGEGGGCLALHTTAGEDVITFDVEARPDEGRKLNDGALDGLQRAAALCEALLLPSGATASARDGGVTLVVPRAASV